CASSLRWTFAYW
nr:immunoglobulin heavy chain junction region [Mus musculus]